MKSRSGNVLTKICLFWYGVVVIFAVLLSVSLFACGGGGGGGSGSSNNSSNSNPSDGELLGWWEAQWSEDGRSINIKYTKGNNTLSETTITTNTYNKYGMLVGKYEETTAIGEDIYGREQNLIYKKPYVFTGGSVKLYQIVRAGTIIYPAGMQFEQGQYSRSINSTTTYQYDSGGSLTGGSYSENFSGQISFPTGKFTYLGDVTATPETKDGQLFFKQQVETTDYYDGNKFYAETERIINGSLQYLGGKWVTVSENHVTKTTYANGSQRNSNITILWQRDQNGVTSGKSGSGVVTGSESIYGKLINYTGSITVDYSFDSKLGWYKSGYYESRVAESLLPKRLPFEVIFIDDMYF